MPKDWRFLLHRPVQETTPPLQTALCSIKVNAFMTPRGPLLYLQKPATAK
jgi:hypothetical protein